MDNSKTKIGVWLDFDIAYIIKHHNNQDSIQSIDSNIEHFNLHGGSRSSTAYGPQDNVSESKLLERKKHQQKDFYQRIIDALDVSDQLLLFGPAEAKFGLKKAVENHPNFKQSKLFVETVDSMTENQLKASLRDYTFED